MAQQDEAADELMAWRARHSLSQAQAAEVLGVTRGTIVEWEAGASRVRRMVRLALRYVDEHPEAISTLP